MSVEFCGLRLAHPILNGSGTFDAIAARRVFGEALDREFPFAAFVSKTITLAPRAGNPPPRLWEAQAGLVNSIGLPNKGLEGYLEQDLPELGRLPVPLITNVMGSTAEEIAELLRACDRHEEIAAFELNVSCPNVHTGLDIGADPVQLERMVATVRPATAKPLIVKLTPNCADVGECARAAEAGGADALSLINTLRALARCDPAGHACRRGSVAATLAGRWHRGALGSRDPTGCAGPGRHCGGARLAPGHWHGRRANGRPRAPVSRRRRATRSGRNRELSRPIGGIAHRSGADGALRAWPCPSGMVPNVCTLSPLSLPSLTSVGDLRPKNPCKAATPPSTILDIPKAQPELHANSSRLP